MSTQTDWQMMCKIDVGDWKTGWLAKNNEGKERTLIVIDKDRFPVISDKEADEIYQQESKIFVEKMKNLVEIQGTDRDKKDFAGIPIVYSLCQNEKGYAMAEIEFIGGKPIKDALLGRDINLFMAHFKGLFEGLAYIHSKKMLVLDWNPRFILTDLGTGHTKILDIWKLRKKDNEPPNLNDLDWRYSSPEAFSSSVPDERSDLYSLALIMYETWCGLKHSFYNYSRSYSAAYGKMQNEFRREQYPDGKLRFDPIFPHHLDWFPMSKEMERDATMATFYKMMEEEKEEPDEMRIRGYPVTEAPDELKYGLVYPLLKKNPAERKFETAEQVIHYIEEKWPTTLKPADQIYAGTMTTVKITT